MSVIFCIAIVFRGEKILSYGGDAGGGGCEEGGEVGCHDVCCVAAREWVTCSSVPSLSDNYYWKSEFWYKCDCGEEDSVSYEEGLLWWLFMRLCGS